MLQAYVLSHNFLPLLYFLNEFVPLLNAALLYPLDHSFFVGHEQLLQHNFLKFQFRKKKTKFKIDTFSIIIIDIYIYKLSNHIWKQFKKNFAKFNAVLYILIQLWWPEQALKLFHILCKSIVIRKMADEMI